jgi:hypothetical protein
MNLIFFFSFTLQYIESFYLSFLKSATTWFNLVMTVFDAWIYIKYHRNWILTQLHAILLSLHILAVFNLSTRTLFRMTISIMQWLDKKYIRLNLSSLFNAYNRQPRFMYTRVCFYYETETAISKIIILVSL